jgi:SAM-dependent methyltransferase
VRLLGRNAVPAGAALLEAAPGVGAYGPVWRRLGVSRWVGLDISGDAVAHCRRRYPWGTFLRQDLAEAAWPAEAARESGFDVVTAIDVLYHLTDDAAFETALKGLAARLRPGGLLVVSDVFVERDRRIAAHVKRRPLEAYRRVLGPELELADREPVFAILGDPVPRPGAALDGALSLAWRGLARGVQAVPAAWRSAAGGAAVLALWPLDGLLRALGAARGVNLELALFRRRNVCAA